MTPTFNGSGFLSAALESVSVQSGNVEHIVIDGGSTDGTVSLLEQFQNPFLRWISEPDDGQSDALNKALAISTGEIIGWLNSDEWYLDGVISEVRALFAENPHVDVIYGEYHTVDDQKQYLETITGHRFSRGLLRWYGCFVPSCATFVRRSCLPDSPWDVDLKWIMDWDLWLRLDTRGSRFMHVPRPYSAFTLHPNQVTAGDRSAHAHEWAAVRARYRISGRDLRGLRELVGRWGHGLLKVLDGAYLRQRRFARELHLSQVSIPVRSTTGQ